MDLNMLLDYLFLTVTPSHKEKFWHMRVWEKSDSEALFHADFKSGIKTWKNVAYFF